MKALFTILFSLCVTVGTSFNTRFYSIDDVAYAMNTGNASQLSQYFDNRVDITLHDKSNSYSSRQAEMILKDFFINYSVKNFRVLHKGANNGSEFCIGNLQTKNGIFRTTIFMKARTEKQVLQEIRFEENE